MVGSITYKQKCQCSEHNRCFCLGSTLHIPKIATILFVYKMEQFWCSFWPNTHHIIGWSTMVHYYKIYRWWEQDISWYLEMTIICITLKMQCTYFPLLKMCPKCGFSYFLLFSDIGMLKESYVLDDVRILKDSMLIQKHTSWFPPILVRCYEGVLSSSTITFYIDAFYRHEKRDIGENILLQ